MGLEQYSDVGELWDRHVCGDPPHVCLKRRKTPRSQGKSRLQDASAARLARNLETFRSMDGSVVIRSFALSRLWITVE
jgi:hypothetical protein